MPHNEEAPDVTRIRIGVARVAPDDVPFSTGDPIAGPMMDRFAQVAVDVRNGREPPGPDDRAVFTDDDRTHMIAGFPLLPASSLPLVFVQATFNTAPRPDVLAELLASADTLLAELVKQYMSVLALSPELLSARASSPFIRKPAFRSAPPTEASSALWKDVIFTCRKYSGISGIATLGMLPIGANALLTNSNELRGPADIVIICGSGRPRAVVNEPSRIREAGMPHRPSRGTLLIIVSAPLRTGQNSPFLQLVRRYASCLRDFNCIATEGTANCLRASGLFPNILALRPGRAGGVIEAICAVADGAADAAVLLFDPTHPTYGLPENEALEELARRSGRPTLTSLGDFEEWLADQSTRSPAQSPTTAPPCVANQSPRDPSLYWTGGRPPQVDTGEENVDERGRIRFLPVTDSTIAVTAHDSRKSELVCEVIRHLEWFARHQRILATCGTAQALRAALNAAKGPGLWRDSPYPLQVCGLSVDQATARELLARLVELRPGLEGGCALIAREVLHHRCHAVLAFAQRHDVTEVPHLQVIERACKYSDGGGGRQAVFATFISTADGLARWVDRAVRRTGREPGLPEYLLALQRECRLRDVVCIEPSNEEDSDDLAYMLARAAAGYVHEWLSCAAARRAAVRIGVSHGRTIHYLAYELEGLARDAKARGQSVALTTASWLVLGGSLYSESLDVDAGVIARRLAKAYGGSVIEFASPPIIDVNAREIVRERAVHIRDQARACDLVVASVAPWDERAEPGRGPVIKRYSAPGAVGIIGTALFDARGESVKATHKPVGLDVDDFRAIARSRDENRGVVAICGGASRIAAAEAVARGGLASVLVTTSATVRAVVDRGGFIHRA